MNKFISTVVLAATVLSSFPSHAASMGRAGSVSVGRSASVSRPSVAPSRPSVAPAPAHPGGIGGTQSAMGVRKSEVTAPVAQKVNPPASPSYSSPGTSPRYSSPPPTYGTANAPNYGGGGVTNGSTFVSSMGGAIAGTLLGNAISGGHGHGGGTTVINNGGGTSAPAVVAGGSSSSFDQSGPGGYTQVVEKKSNYGFWHFIIDVLLFTLTAVVLVGVIWLFYKGFKMIKNYINKERGVTPKQPFSPTAQFWLIQKAFASGDAEQLAPLLGPDLVDEATRELIATELTLSKVSHEVVLDTPREFSVHYTFNDGAIVCNQVWHYELHGTWKLNGIENV